MAISIEQAVEIILAGEASFMCHVCMGQGSTMQVHDVFESCPACSGSGHLRNPEYDEACEVLDRPKPVFENPAEKAWRDILKSKMENNYVADYAKSDVELSLKLMKTQNLAKAFKMDVDPSKNWGKPK